MSKPVLAARYRRLLGLALVGLGLLGMSPRAQAQTVGERLVLEARVDAVRQALQRAAVTDTQTAAVEQWLNWPNWNNWNNWGNWGNWPNWGNWGNWFNR